MARDVVKFLKVINIHAWFATRSRIKHSGPHVKNANSIKW